MALILPPITEERRIQLSGGYSTYDHLIVRDYQYWRLYLNKDQTYLYRCYIWLLGTHVDLQQRPQLESWKEKELARIVKDVHEALALLSKPDMVNEFYGGNEYRIHRGHAHLHLIPRYAEPPTFAGKRFPDPRFGSNYVPYRRKKFQRSLLSKLRHSLQEALAKVSLVP